MLQVLHVLELEKQRIQMMRLAGLTRWLVASGQHRLAMQLHQRRLKLLQTLLHGLSRHRLDLVKRQLLVPLMLLRAGRIQAAAAIDGLLDDAEDGACAAPIAQQLGGQHALLLQVFVVPVQLGVSQIAERGHIELQIVMCATQGQLKGKQ